MTSDFTHGAVYKSKKGSSEGFTPLPPYIITIKHKSKHASYTFKSFVSAEELTETMSKHKNTLTFELIH